MFGYDSEYLVTEWSKSLPFLFSFVLISTFVLCRFLFLKHLMARYLRAMLLHAMVSNFLLNVETVQAYLPCPDSCFCCAVARLNPDNNLFGSSSIEYVRDCCLASGHGVVLLFIYFHMFNSFSRSYVFFVWFIGFHRVKLSNGLIFLLMRLMLI